MSKTNAIGCLAVAGVIAFLGGTLEGRIGLPSSILFGIMMFLVMLLTYPAAKQRGGANRSLTFKRWALGALVASLTTTVIILTLNRLVNML